MSTDSREIALAASPAFVGPRDRESFFDAQRRNRRATWRMSALCTLAGALMGIPLALTITPLLYGVVLIVADVVNIWWPLPAAFWQLSGEVAHYGIASLQSLLQGRFASMQGFALGAVVMLLPGAALSFILWLGMSALFRHGGVGGALLALNAREPNQSDLKELRLADVVQEMAIAAGLPTPRVMLIDAPGPNAAAIGTSPADARIVVSRRLLDNLSRDELEGALAHLIASIGNGDLRIAFRATAILETCGLLLTVINAPFGRQSHRTLWRIVRYGFGGSAKNGGAQEAMAVADILTRNLSLEADDIDRMFDSTKKRSILRSIRDFLLFPIFLTNFAIKMSLWFFSFAVLGPSLGLLWRTRKYLADASAVQLTRNPDGLAGALQKLAADNGPIPGSESAPHLFIVKPGTSSNGSSGAEDKRRIALLAQAWTASAQNSGSAAPQAAANDFAAMFKEAAATQRAALSGDAQALARIAALKQSLSTLDPALAAQVPDLADVTAARQGDRAAIARLLASRCQQVSMAKTLSPSSAASGAGESGGIASAGFVGFHPSLKRRLKRLDRMGAHAEIEAADPKMRLVIVIMSLVFGPLFLLLLGLFLLLITILVLSSLAFVVIWLAIIHQLFALITHH